MAGKLSLQGYVQRLVFYPRLCSPRPPLLAALSGSAYHRDWRDMWSPGLHYGKLWLRYPCGITVIWPENHYSRADKHICTLTSVHTDTFQDPPWALLPSLTTPKLPKAGQLKQRKRKMYAGKIRGFIQHATKSDHWVLVHEHVCLSLVTLWQQVRGFLSKVGGQMVWFHLPQTSPGPATAQWAAKRREYRKPLERLTNCQNVRCPEAGTADKCLFVWMGQHTSQSGL